MPWEERGRGQNPAPAVGPRPGEGRPPDLGSLTRAVLRRAPLMPVSFRPRTAPTLRLRIVLAWALIALLLAGALSFVAYEVTRQGLVDERTSGSLDRAFVHARLLRSALRATDADVSAALASLDTSSEASVLARVRGGWFAGSVGTGPDVVPDSLLQAVDDGLAGHQRVRIDGTPHLAIGVPIAAADAAYFELVDIEEIENTLDTLGERLLLGGAIAAALAAGAGYYASGRVLRPLRRFASAAEQLAIGELDTRLESLGDADLRALERAFNRMADSVQQRIDREARFTSDVSHELRSPVASMLAAINIARSRHDDPVAAAMAMDALADATHKLHRTVEDLLEISRIEAGVADLRLEPVDPDRLVRAILARMGRSEVPVEGVGGGSATFDGDKRRLGQMLQNLVENAERYGGGVTRVEIAVDASSVRFAVEDAGPGIPEHERSYIFERFARGEAAASVGGGTGLGLSLVAEHAALHGGTVRLDDVDTGARFVIEIPLRGTR